MSRWIEFKQQCRFCLYFRTKYKKGIRFYRCASNRFDNVDGASGFPDLAPFCDNFTLDDRPDSRWIKLSQDYKDTLI